MPKILDVHQHYFNKHEHAFKRLLQPLSNSLNLLGASYTKVYPNDMVIDLPIIKHQIHEIWLMSEHTTEPAFSHKNLLQLPKIFCYYDLEMLLKNESNWLSTINNMTKTKASSLQCLKYNLDGSISRLSLIVNIPLTSSAIIFNSYYNMFDECIRKIEDYLFDECKRHYLNFDITEDINPLPLQTLSELETIAPKLAKAEIKCFKQIYCGIYEAKQIAHMLHRSPRTVENTIANLCHKLECNSKIELVVKISHMHDVMRHFMQHHFSVA